MYQDMPQTTPKKPISRHGDICGFYLYISFHRPIQTLIVYRCATDVLLYVCIQQQQLQMVEKSVSEISTHDNNRK